jgi:hypothetical protein
MRLGAVKIYDNNMKFVKKISPEKVSKIFWDNIYRKKDLKLNKQLKSPERDDKLYKKIRHNIITKNIKKRGRKNEGKTK